MNSTLKSLLFWMALVVVALGIWEISNANADRTPDPTPALLAIEDQRRDAIKRGDFATLDTIYASDFTAIAGGGQVIDKADLMAIFKRNDPSVTFMTDEIKVRVLGQTAVFTGRLVGRGADGLVVSASRFTHVFAKRDGRWQCVAGQSTAIANPS